MSAVPAGSGRDGAIDLQNLTDLGCVERQHRPAGIKHQSMHILVSCAADIFLGTGNYRYEDNFTAAQFAGRHSLPKEVLGAVLVNREAALAVLVSLIDNVRLTLTRVRIKCAQKLRTRLFHPITFWLTKVPPIPQSSWSLNLMLLPGDS